jgi:hypothetical protein
MITVRANSRLILDYKRLLVSEWTRTFPQQVLELLWDAIGARQSSNENGRLRPLLDPANVASFPTEYFRSIVDRIANGTKFVRVAELPELPAEYQPPKRPPAAVWQSVRLVTYLTLQAHATVDGDTSFFADAQALAFQAATHVLLPTLREKHTAEHALLLHAATLFALGYAAVDPAHYAYMMSMIFDYLGDEEQHLRSLYASFRFTSPQDHSYLTKAQEYWSDLLDVHRYQEAQEFLFSLHWWSLPTQHEEVREMITEAFRHMPAAKANHR